MMEQYSIDLSGVLHDGVLNSDVLAQVPGYQPEEVRKAMGARVVIECAQNIPCNPCQTSCPQGAITVGEPITNLPVVDLEKCVGCGLCVAACPGLAIFLVNYHASEECATVTFSYEYLPVPEKGQTVKGTDRAGKPVCDAVVEKVVSAPGYDMTKVITIRIPAEYADVVRGMQMLKER